MDQQIYERLRGAARVLIASHVRPDGDAIGSVLGLGLALEEAGKSVQMVLADGVPSTFRHLTGSEKVLTRPNGEFDLFISLDCADRKRLGEPLQKLGCPHINIDHHVTNERFGELNLIEAEAVATAAILTEHLPRWGLEISPSVADALLTGIVTDTLGFRTSNVTPHALRLAADLMERGANLAELYMRGLVRRSLAAARYWGAGLSKLRHDDGIIWSTLTLQDRRAAGYQGNDDADLINIISAIDGGLVGMIFVEQENQHVKVSWRALEEGIDVSQVARAFGGGGHQAAAGADIPGNMETVVPKVLELTRQMLITRSSQNRI